MSASGTVTHRRLLRTFAGLAGTALLAWGCGSSGSSASPSASSASVSASAAVSPSVSPAPSTADGDQIIDTFLSEFAQEDTNFHTDFEGTITTEGEGQSVDTDLDGDLDIAGSDGAGELTVSAGGQEATVEVVILDGDAYARPEGGAWQKNEDFRQTQPLNPFLKLSADALSYEGEKERGGQRVHHLQTTQWTGDDPSTLESQGLTDGEIEDTTFDIYVTEQGEPVESVLEFTMTGKSQGVPVEIAGEFTYRFSDIGKNVTIEAPSVP